MGRYQYRATDKEGLDLSGEVEAATSHEVTVMLEQKGLQVSSVKHLPEQIFLSGKRTTISLDDLMIFNRHLASMTKTGLPIPESLKQMAVELKNRKFKYLIENNMLLTIENIDKPKKLRYELTEGGIKLAAVLKTIREWSLEFGTCDNEKCINNLCRHGEAIGQLLKLNTL